MQFLLPGLLTAAVGEWQFSVFLQGDPGNFVGSLAFNALYLTGVYLVTRLLLKALSDHPKFILIYTGISGVSGLLVEWFLIGNSPWGNPQASQIGMFAYWACVALVSLMFLLQNHAVQAFILRYGLAYIALALLGQFLIASPAWRFAFHIYAFILGYSGLMIGILKYSIHSRKSPL